MTKFSKFFSLVLLISILISTGCSSSSYYAKMPLATPYQSTAAKTGDDFQSFKDNPIHLVSEAPVSTFSADVDTASYTFARRRLNEGYLPEKDAVRLEEFINYFDYDYAKPESSDQPFSVTTYVHASPWAKDRQLIHIGIQGYQIDEAEKPDSNIVFLLDVSGSMSQEDKLPLVKKSMELLLSQLKPTDTISIVAYAGATGVVLEPTPVKQKSKILSAMNRLDAGGSTAGGEGIQLAYQLAEENFKEGAVNRIILATDGDFNVGITDHEQLKALVERKGENGVFLSVLGFGQGNYHDSLMQVLAQNGNGIAAYIDTLGEAQKVLVHEATSSLFPIATDLKLQVEFNPRRVEEYRLLGYETRQLDREDFNNDKVDAGDIGSGHRVTAIYEVALVGGEGSAMDPLRYQPQGVLQQDDESSKQDELAFLKIRYKRPGETESQLEQKPIIPQAKASAVPESLVREVNFATAVAAFAQLLRNDKYLHNWEYKDALALAQKNKGEDEYGYRSEFVQLIRKAQMAKQF